MNLGDYFLQCARNLQADIDELPGTEQMMLNMAQVQQRILEI
jgi:hypothetical protein